MKLLTRFFSCAVAILALSACSDEPPLKNSDNPDLNVNLNVNLDPFVEAAERAYNLCYGSDSRSSATFYAHDVVAVTALKSRAQTPDTVLYIVNEANGNGFVALTGGNRPEILAVSDNGTIENIEDIDNPGLKMFFDAAQQYALLLPDSLIVPEKPIPYIKETILIEELGSCPPRCKTQWGQQYPEGLYCPNGLSGCTITATAQALSYFQIPDTINLHFAEADKAFADLNWNNIIDYTVSCSWSEYNQPNKRLPQQREAEAELGRLCRELGFRMNANYRAGATGASLDSMAKVVRRLCPDLKVEGRYYGAPIARIHLQSGIIIMQGSSYAPGFDHHDFGHNCSTDGCGAHAFIVDGYKHQIINHSIFYLNGETGEYDYSDIDSYIETIDLQHLNWGWRGKCNGYFNLNVFKADQAEIPDTNNNSIENNYNHALSYFLILPK